MKRIRIIVGLIGAAALSHSAAARPTTHIVMVSGLTFTPNPVNAQSGDTITWTGLGGFHTITQTTAAGSCTAQANPIFGSTSGATTYSWVIPSNLTGTFFYKCNPHCTANMKGTINITAPPPPPCPGDANGDGVVDFSDATSVLANWGGPGPAGDADHDGDVDFADITGVLANFGVPCP